MFKSRFLADFFSPTAKASYEKNLEDETCIHAMCEDYRASSPGGGSVPTGPDYLLDKSDFDDKNGKRIQCDLMVLWGKKGALDGFWDVKKEWGRICVGNVTGRSVNSGHYIAEGENLDTVSTNYSSLPVI